MWDSLNDWLDSVVLHALALWLAFVTLPSLDKATVMPDGTTVYPSRGTPGSCYTTRDGQHYVRTGRGTRKVGKEVGQMLIARSKKIRRTAIVNRAVIVGALLVVPIIAAFIVSQLS